MKKWPEIILALMLAGVSLGLVLSGNPAARASGSLHYTANENFVNGVYQPGTLGFNLADVTDKATLDSAPAGVLGLVFLDGCQGATATFVNAATPLAGDPKLWGIYLADEANGGTCTPANLKAASDWVHTHLVGAKTFIIPNNLCADASPCFSNGSNPALLPSNTDIDYFGPSAYPCKTDAPGGCDFAVINRYVAAEQAVGMPTAAMIPVYQAFGGNNAWTDDTGGFFAVPTAAQDTTTLSTWASLLASPTFDYVYSCGVQVGDTGATDIALSDAPASLQQVFANHNGVVAAPSNLNCPVVNNPVIGQQINCTYQ